MIALRKLGQIKGNICLNDWGSLVLPREVFWCKNALVSPGQIRFTHEEMNIKIFISISAVRRHFINFILYSFMRGARRGTMRIVYTSFSSPHKIQMCINRSLYKQFHVHEGKKNCTLKGFRINSMWKKIFAWKRHIVNKLR